MFMFSEFVPDAKRRFGAGYWFLTLVGINALVNIAYQYADAPFQILKYPKKWFKRVKHEYNKRFGKKKAPAKKEVPEATQPEPEIPNMRREVLPPLS